MEMALIILKQTLIMALYMICGWVLYKTGRITQEGSKSIASLLMSLVVPCMIIRSFCTPFSTQRLADLGWSFLLSGVALILSCIAARLLFSKNGTECFGVAFSNIGFIGIPLVTAALGDGAVFYLCGVHIWFNLLQCTWGIPLLCGPNRGPSLKKMMLNPIILSLPVGVVLFATGLGMRLPSLLSSTIDGIANVNGPLAMVVLGVYLAQTDLKKLFVTPRLYWMSAVRLWLIPLLTLPLFLLFPVSSDVKMTVLIAAAAPIGANVAVYGQLYDADYPYGCQMVAFSTVLSIVMMPLFIVVAGPVLGM